MATDKHTSRLKCRDRNEPEPSEDDGGLLNDGTFWGRATGEAFAPTFPGAGPELFFIKIHHEKIGSGGTSHF
jgi:hypothetical protein